LTDNFELIKEKIDLMQYVRERVQLKRSGKSWKGLCPFHSEKTPSFTVDPERKTFKCYGCEAGGTIIDYVMQERGIKNPSEVLEQLARDFDIPLHGFDTEAWAKRKERIAVNRSEALKYYNDGRDAAQYLIDRGIKPETSKAFGLGYRKDDHSLTIPFLNTYGEVVGISYRYLTPGAEPKYKNAAESETFRKSELLFGLDKARKHMNDALYVVEGYFDVMSLHQMGFPNAVGYCGSTLTDAQAAIIGKYIAPKTKIYLIPDNDETGLAAVRKNVDQLLIHVRNQIRIIQLPADEKDMNDFLINYNESATDRFKELRGEPHEMFLLKYDIDRCSDIHDEYEVAREVAQMTKNTMIRAEMADFLVKRWDKDKELVHELMNSDPGSVRSYDDDLISFSSALDDYRQYVKQGDEGKVFFGLTDLDAIIRGMRRGEVGTVLGRSGSGKTTFILNLIYQACFNQNHRVVFNSLELHRVNVVPQLLQIIKEMQERQIEDMYKNDREPFEDLELYERLDNSFRLVDRDGQTLQDIEMTARAAGRLFGEPVSLIVIDYFQQIRFPGKRPAYEEKSEGARELKSLAKRLNCVVVALSQSTREGGGSGEKKLRMDSARDTGAIEEASDYMVGIYRPSSDPEMDPNERLGGMNDMHCQILKNRWGPIGEVLLHFEPMIKKIGDATDGQKRSAAERSFQPKDRKPNNWRNSKRTGKGYGGGT
jgi:replicative DNA helicase